MSGADSLRISLEVLRDWRVIAAAVAILLAWAIFRYVGLVFHRAPRRGAKRRRFIFMKKKAGPKVASLPTDEES